MDIYNYIHKPKGSDDIYDNENLIFSIHKPGKQKTMPYTLFREKISENETISMKYDGLHCVKCHIKLPKIVCNSNFNIAWDYNEIIKRIKIIFNTEVIDDRTNVYYKELKFSSHIDDHSIIINLPSFYNTIHTYFPLFKCKKSDILQHIIEYNLDLNDLIKCRNIELNTEVNYNSDIIINDIKSIEKPVLESYYIKLTQAEIDQYKNETNRYIVERRIELKSNHKKINLSVNKVISKIRWYNKGLQKTSLTINDDNVMVNLDNWITKKDTFHEYNFNFVEDSRKYSNSVYLTNGYLELETDDLNTIIEMNELIEIKFN